MNTTLIFCHLTFFKYRIEVIYFSKILNFILSSYFFAIFSILKQFAANKDDRRRVEKALDVSGLPSGKGDSLPLNKFQFEDFFNLYKNLTQRTEVEKIFDEL